MKQGIKDKLQKIDKDHFSLLVDIGQIAFDEGLKAYLVGGMVRDLLLGFNNLDIDIVVENNAILLADSIHKRFSNCELVAKHEKFHTAKLNFKINSKQIPIDLASTRQEIYEYPASLPTVRISNLKKDLFRRDFTVNALAVSLMPGEFGEVVDLFDGLVDLKNKKIRILHDMSFIDDPTRMIRAVRFACKLGFEIEEHTKELLADAINSGQFDNLIEKIRGDRVKIEIRYLFNLPNIKQAVNVFFESGIYKMISTDLDCAGRGVINHVSTKQQWLVCLALIMKDLSTEQQNQIMKNLQMTSEETKIISSAFNAHEHLSKYKELDSVIIYKELKNLVYESVLIVKLLFGPNPLIDEYLEKTSKIKLEITGEDLINLGIKEGKAIGEVLEKVLEKKIKNPQMKKEDEMREARSLVRQGS